MEKLPIWHYFELRGPQIVAQRTKGGLLKGEMPFEALKAAP